MNLHLGKLSSEILSKIGNSREIPRGKIAIL